MDNEVGKRIRELRTINGVTQEEIANKLGVSKSTVSKWELGKIDTMKTTHIKKIALMLDTSIQYLLGLETEKDNRFSCSYEEKEIIKEFRNADSQTQEMVKRLLGYYNLISKKGGTNDGK